MAYLIDEIGKKDSYLCCISSHVRNVHSFLAVHGVMSGFTIFGVGFFDFFDILTDKIFLAIGGMLLAIFVGWFMDKEELKAEVTNNGEVSFGLFEAWYAMIKYVIPVLIAVVAYTGITAIEQKSLMIFGLLVIVVSAIFSKKL